MKNPSLAHSLFLTASLYVLTMGSFIAWAFQ